MTKSYAARSASLAIVWGAFLAGWIEPTLAEPPERQQPVKEDVSRLIADLSAADEATRIRAAERLKQLGPDAASAADALAEILKDSFYSEQKHSPDFVQAVEGALKAIGSPAIPVIVKELDSARPTQNPPVNLVDILGSYGSDGIDAMIRLLNHDHPGLREAAIKALGTKRRLARTAVPHIARSLAPATDSKVRLSAVEALGKIGRYARPGEIEPYLSTIASPLTNLARADDPRLSLAAASSFLLTHRNDFAEHRDAVSQIVRILADRLDHTDVHVRRTAAAHICLARGFAANVTDELIEAARTDADAVVRLNAVEALGEISQGYFNGADYAPGEEPVIDALVAALADHAPAVVDTSEPGDQTPALAARRAVARKRKKFVPKLIAMLDKELDEATRYAVVATIVETRAETPADRIVPVLVAALQSADIGRRCEACEYLARVGPAAKDAVPQLIKLVKAQEATVPSTVPAWSVSQHDRAVEALASIGSDAHSAIPDLIRLLKRQYDESRFRSALKTYRAIRRIDPNSDFPENAPVLDLMALSVNEMLSGRSFERKEKRGDADVTWRITFGELKRDPEKAGAVYESRSPRVVTTEGSSGEKTTQRGHIISRLSREGNRVLLTEIVVAEDGSANPPATAEVDTVRSYELIVRLSKEDLAKAARGDWISCTWGLRKDRGVEGVRRYKDSERVNLWNPMRYEPVDVY